MEKPRVFVSYSWDSEEHQQWVLYLVNHLRAQGIQAEADVFETQTKSVHLYKMMVEKVRDSDYLIIVLTENYARKADGFQGGVGFESQLSLPLLMESPDKLIPIMRHNGDFNAVFPYHLKGMYAIDFSNDGLYETKLKELLHRILKKPLYHFEPIGEIPSLEPIVPVRSPRKEITESYSIPNLKRITDKDKTDFLLTSFNEIVENLESIFSKVREYNPNFDYKVERDTQKIVFSLFVDGKLNQLIRLMISSDFGRHSISILYGNSVFMISDTSSNEIIVSELNEKNELELRPLLHSFSQESLNTKEIAIRMWEDHIVGLIR